MSRKDLIKKKFLAVMSNVRKALHDVPDNVETAKDYRTFFIKTLKTFKSNGKITDYTVHVNGKTHTFDIIYQPYCGEKVVIIEGDFSPYDAYYE